MAMNVKGTVIHILNVETGVSKANKEWKKRGFVIETQDQYPKTICFDTFGEKTSLIDNISEGQEVDVHFNLESREYNGKYFHNINAWKIEGGSAPAQTTATTGLTNHNQAAEMPTATEDNSDTLPF